MFSFLKKLLNKKLFVEEQPQAARPQKDFKFLITDDASDIPLNTWYRMFHWDSTHFLKMESEWTKDWKMYSAEEPVVGVTYENRQGNFVFMGDQPDFRIYLEREPTSPYDPNAIKVMGTATVAGNKMVGQLGYLSRETAKNLKDEPDLDARPRLVYMPTDGKRYSLRIRILIRPVRYKKKQEKLLKRQKQKPPPANDFIRVKCQCGKTLKAPIKFAGRKAKCPYCGAPHLLPER
ncbi:MAG: HIRAN domain-containing protein [Planctomycetota bacterium]